ncbi:MAG: biopolymer transporter ExbD [Polyangiaceae bacterium]
MDVVLVLLIIFMVVTPAINEGEAVELPEIFNISAKKDGEPIEVTMAPEGVFVLDHERITAQSLGPKLKAMHEAEPDRWLMLKADSTLPYKDVRETFAELQHIGFFGVSLKVIQKKPAGA